MTYSNRLTSNDSETQGKTTSDHGMEFTLQSIVNNRPELEHFRTFLVDNFASTDDLNCWLDIEALRRVPDRLREARARLVVRKYFNDLYFYGPASPASKQEQEMVKQAMKKTGDATPPIESLYEAQTYVERRLVHKWLAQFTASPDFIERQRPRVSIGHVVDDVIASHRRRTVHSIQRVMGNRWSLSQEKITHFRTSLGNPLTSQMFRRYVSARGERHENNVLFWQEAEKYRELCSAGADESLLTHKSAAIIACYLDSQISPSIQVSVDRQLVQAVLQQQRQHRATANLFRDAQRCVFVELLPLWEEFCRYRDETKLADDQPVKTTARQHTRHSVKSAANRPQAKDKRKHHSKKSSSSTAWEEKSSRSVTSSVVEYNSAETNDVTCSAVAQRGDITASVNARDYVLHWCYSKYLQALSKEQSLNAVDVASLCSSKQSSVRPGPDVLRLQSATDNLSNWTRSQLNISSSRSTRSVASLTHDTRSRTSSTQQTSRPGTAKQTRPVRLAATPNV